MKSYKQIKISQWNIFNYMFVGLLDDITLVPHIIIETLCESVSGEQRLQKDTHFSSGCSRATEQTSASHLAGQIDPYSMFLTSLIYMQP